MPDRAVPVGAVSPCWPYTGTSLLLSAQARAEHISLACHGPHLGQHLLLRWFMEAIQSLDSVNVHIQFPRAHFDATTGTDEMARAVEAWTNWNFKAFGYNSHG